VISLHGKGELFINLGGDGETPVTLGVVKDRVMKVLAAKPGTPVQLRGDQGIDYGNVMEVMAALQGVGVTSIGLVAETP
jgi:biopolymer transport protein TolR